MGLESLIPGPLKNPYRRLRSRLKNRAYGRSNSDIFNKIYDRRAWGEGDEGGFYSGSGSYGHDIDAYVELIRKFVAEAHVKSIIDIGCGDFSVGRRYADIVNAYTGVDASRLVVEYNNAKYGTDSIRFEAADASETVFPSHDLCIIRQVLQHLDNSSIKKILENTKGHRFVLVTEHLPPSRALKEPNLDKRSGPDTRLMFGSGVYLEAGPFNRSGEVLLELPASDPQVGPGEIFRTTLLRN